MKELKELIQALGPILTVVSTLAAVWLTQKWNRQTQKELLEQQLIRDAKKERRNELKETLEVYNKILKAYGENEVVIEGPKAENLGEFDFNVYQEKIRPILYEKYHLLHDEIAETVAGIDELLKKCSYFEEVERIDHFDLIEKYEKLIRIVKQNIYNFRKEGR
ncbi:hypothetical protein COD21_12325 [Bacillus cereus]|uniref:hypothetical protein n=1 Tax=Bacillus cereus TaxID=1396 RepID=UPI000BFC506B|nr:hypothetical protein [Bacillus cereus]MED3355621.1 hypothetical protein [Bacillus thuringiensis]PGU11101.1 hypothetical protein COD21_12325 [Bacillus cereus]HDR4482477.1 hypothetical protein [Bacillus cereus]